MAIQATNWALNTYTVDTWTTVVDETATATVSVLNICNPTANPIIVELRLFDGANGTYILAPYTMESNESYAMELKGFVVLDTQTIELKADTVGVEVVASGAYQI